MMIMDKNTFICINYKMIRINLNRIGNIDLTMRDIKILDQMIYHEHKKERKKWKTQILK
jgi:hypothetical protein